MAASVTSEGDKTTKSAPASVLREIQFQQWHRPKPSFQKYTVVFLRYNGEIIRINIDSDWLWDKLRSVVETRIHLPPGSALAALRCADGTLIRAAADIQNGEYLNVEMRYEMNLYATDDEYASDVKHLSRQTAKAAVAAAALHGHDRKAVQGVSSGVVAGRRGGVLATAHGQVGTSRGGKALGGARGGGGAKGRPIVPCPVPVRPEEIARRERLKLALAHAELPEADKEEHDAQKWASTLLGRPYEHHPGDPEGPVQTGIAKYETPVSSPRGPEQTSPRNINCPIFPEAQTAPAAHVAFPSKRWYRLDDDNAPPPKEDFTYLEFLYRTKNMIGMSRTLPKHLQKALPGQQQAPPPWDKALKAGVINSDTQVRTWNFIEPHMMPSHEHHVHRPKEKARPFANSPRLARKVNEVTVSEPQTTTPLQRNQTQDVNTGGDLAVTRAVTMVEATIPAIKLPTALRPSVRIDGGDRSVVSFADDTIDNGSLAGSRVPTTKKKTRIRIVDPKDNAQQSSPRSPRPTPPKGPWKPGNSTGRAFTYHMAATAEATGHTAAV